MPQSARRWRVARRDPCRCPTARCTFWSCRGRTTFPTLPCTLFLPRRPRRRGSGRLHARCRTTREDPSRTRWLCSNGGTSRGSSRSWSPVLRPLTHQGTSRRRPHCSVYRCLIDPRSTHTRLPGQRSGVATTAFGRCSYSSVYCWVHGRPGIGKAARRSAGERRRSGGAAPHLPSAPPAAPDLHALRVEGDVDVSVLDLQLVGWDCFHRGEALGLAGLYVELGAVEGTLDLFPLQPTLAKVGKLVSADVLDGVEFAVHVAQGHGPPLDLVLLHLARTHLVGLRHLAELGHASRPPAPRSQVQSCPR